MVFEFFRSRIASFKYAFNGWWYVIRTQRNAWIHALASVAVIIVAIAFVWTAEFFNTALEVIVDLATHDTHPLAKVGKDVGAAAVLIASITAAIIGIIVLGPPLLAKIVP